jgi:hypothetical protein
MKPRRLSSFWLGLGLASGLATWGDGRPWNEAAWTHELARLAGPLAALPSDFAKTTFLRQYAGALTDVGRLDEHTLRRYRAVSLDRFDPAEYYPLFRDNRLPANCGITSFFYIKLLQAFGFKAYQYSFGYTEAPYERFIHSVALVDVAAEGGRRLIVQDPYLNLTYRTRDGQPMDFAELLGALRARRYGDVVTDASSITTTLLVPDLSLYLPHLDRPCQAQMTGLLTSSDGSMRTEMAIERSYATLMQSECGHFERDFVEAMRRHGLDEPFLFAYTLRAADVVGAPDHAEVQRRIDALLR